MKKAAIVLGIIITLLAVAFFIFKSSTDNKTDPRGDLYAGSKTCAKCHQDIYNSYLHTAHFLASNPANKFTVHGNFSEGFNVFQVNDSQKVIMEKTDSGLFQNYYLDEKVKDKYRFDIVFGGVKGESYLLWKEHKLFQLPLSYFSSEKRWSTSPGYGFNFLDYPDLRSIGKTCMECHASYIDNLPGVESQQLSKGEKFDKSSIVYHIDCERCHGPGQRHVEFQTHNPEFKTAKFITSIHSLSRSQKMDMCAVCHSGVSEIKLRSSFEFVPGDTLAKFKMPSLFKQIDSSQLDVHGNQVQLLESSKCFIYSKMNCATCHNVHAK